MNSRVRSSISATLAEIEAHPLRGLIEPEEKREALAIIARIERRLNERGLESDRKWKPKEAADVNASNR